MSFSKQTVLLVLSVLALLFVIVGIINSEKQKVLSVEPSSWTQDRTASCAIVLTGGPGRVREGFDLLAQKRVKKLIISGVYPAAQLREIFPEWPFYGSINEDDVVLDKRSNTTYGNAVQTVPLVEALNCDSLILITSRLHMYRASRIFKKIHGDQVAIFERAIVSGKYQFDFWDLSLEVVKSLFYNIWAY